MVNLSKYFLLFFGALSTMNMAQSMDHEDPIVVVSHAISTIHQKYPGLLKKGGFALSGLLVASGIVYKVYNRAQQFNVIQDNALRAFLGAAWADLYAVVHHENDVPYALVQSNLMQSYKDLNPLYKTHDMNTIIHDFNSAYKNAIRNPSKIRYTILKTCYYQLQHAIQEIRESTLLGYFGESILQEPPPFS